MPRYNDLISNLGTATIFCNNLGFGEQGAILKNMPKSIFICPDNESCIKMQNQLNALKRNCVVLNDVHIGDNTVIENCIVESRNTIAPNSTLTGTPDKIKIVVEKGNRYGI